MSDTERSPDVAVQRLQMAEQRIITALGIAGRVYMKGCKGEYRGDPDRRRMVLILVENARQDLETLVRAAGTESQGDPVGSPQQTLVPELLKKIDEAVQTVGGEETEYERLGRAEDVVHCMRRGFDAYNGQTVLEYAAQLQTILRGIAPPSIYATTSRQGMELAKQISASCQDSHPILPDHACMQVETALEQLEILFQHFGPHPVSR